MLDLTPQTQNVYNPGTTQKVAYTAVSAKSTNAVGANAVLLVATTDCHVKFAADPTAAATDVFVPAKVPMAFAIDPSFKVAGIRDTADGDLYITSLN